MPDRTAFRAAVYFTPAAGSPLARVAAAWLGRDPFGGGATHEVGDTPPSIVAEPARYGFHATIKAPFRLAPGRTLAELDAALAAFCKTRATVTIGALRLERLGSFFALVPEEAEPGLMGLENAAVRAFEPFRAPLDEAEIARRRPDQLTERQRANLAEWGYPHVFEDFRFHLTLTGRVPDGDAEAIEARLRSRFAPFTGRLLAVDALALFVERQPGEPFEVHAVHPFGSS